MMGRCSAGKLGFSNPDVETKEKQLGRFKFKDLNDSIPVVDKSELMLTEDTRYVGQWSGSGCRHGRGVMTWEDGAKYEGTWANN
jgi:hypothetical protein